MIRRNKRWLDEDSEASVFGGEDMCLKRCEFVKLFSPQSLLMPCLRVCAIAPSHRSSGLSRAPERLDERVATPPRYQVSLNADDFQGSLHHLDGWAIGRKSSTFTLPFSDSATISNRRTESRLHDESYIQKCHRVVNPEGSGMHADWTLPFLRTWHRLKRALNGTTSGKFQGARGFRSSRMSCGHPGSRRPLSQCMSCDRHREIEASATSTISRHLRAAGAGQATWQAPRPTADQPLSPGNPRKWLQKHNCRQPSACRLAGPLVYHASRLGNPAKTSALPPTSSTGSCCREGNLFSRMAFLPRLASIVTWITPRSLTQFVDDG
ncbi:uncharacterized protein B0H64DRAFT_205414 [Chaetomium fimeti]|uniref:Uncharacterized protein n=1 Tax=Chaetomium fimeti TaxID=1854472 RepID=A0AAE0LQ22_9PEZI|nr:hypothetical protein B0H64DRAFT_205414 [Chaetomium fimeti]